MEQNVTGSNGESSHIQLSFFSYFFKFNYKTLYEFYPQQFKLYLDGVWGDHYHCVISYIWHRSYIEQ